MTVATSFRVPLLLILAHAPLGIALYQSRYLATAHAFLSLLLGLVFAFRRRVPLQNVAVVAVYLAGSEVLWRMANAEIYWEFGKYAAAGLMIVALVRREKWQFPSAPAVYLVLLTPACFYALFENSLAEAKDRISFNMSGPFLLFVSCWFFSNLTINWTDLKKALLVLSAPVVSIALVSLFYTVTLEEIEFGTESNFSTSGGYGPNQVSSILGLGAFVCAAVLLLFRNRFRELIVFGAMALLFAAQSMLTFSRGGLYNALGALFVLIVVSLPSLKRDLMKLIPILGAVLLFVLLIFPILNSFTGGALQTRFEDTEATGRLEIVEADFQIFADNPIIGAGVGEARELREAYVGKAVGAHTEFARVLAEHGTLGIFALLVLLFGIGAKLWAQRTNLLTAFAAGGIAWSCLFMMNAGMRLAAPSIMWGVCFLSLNSIRRPKPYQKPQ